MKVKVQQSNEEINSIGGISLIGGLYNSLKSLKKADSMQTSKVKTGKIKHSGIIKTVAGLFALGKNDYADVTPFRKDSFFRDCLKLNVVPSEGTLRQRLDELALLQELFALIRSGNVELVRVLEHRRIKKELKEISALSEQIIKQHVSTKQAVNKNLKRLNQSRQT